jgi:hypothetical protein
MQLQITAQLVTFLPATSAAMTSWCAAAAAAAMHRHSRSCEPRQVMLHLAGATQLGAAHRSRLADVETQHTLPAPPDILCGEPADVWTRCHSSLDTRLHYGSNCHNAALVQDRHHTVGLVSGICSGRLQDSYWRPHGSVRGCKQKCR